MKADPFLQRLWYQGGSRGLRVLLMPLSALFWLVVTLRRAAYRIGLLRTHRVSRPVIVIGNLTVGGTGKTPFVIWLAEWLQGRGVRVGIVLRGYGGTSAHWPRDVDVYTPAVEVGDEAVLHASRTGAIVVAGPDRVAAAARAIERGADVVLCDDGLQHYRLGRDLEIAVLDAQRGLGNGLLLPAGPLREPASRLNAVDLRVYTQRAATPVVSDATSVVTTARLVEAESLQTGERRPLASFTNAPVHAVAGIGNPEAFFAGLRAAGLQIDTRALPDHAALTPADIAFSDTAPVLMTQKDAVKCRAFTDARHWAVRLDLHISDADVARVAALVDRVMNETRSETKNSTGNTGNTGITG